MVEKGKLEGKKKRVNSKYFPPIEYQIERESVEKEKTTEGEAEEIEAESKGKAEEEV